MEGELMIPAVQGASGHAITHRRPFCTQCGHYKAEVCKCEPTKQRKRTSLVEAVINWLVGAGLAIGTQILIYPLFGIYVGLLETIEIAAFFMAISVVRQYFLRRFFEWLRVTGIMP